MSEETTQLAQAGTRITPQGSYGDLSDERLTRGTSLGRYVVLEEVGVGGMGVVYAAYDPRLGRKVALKLLHRALPNADLNVSRLLREAQAMAQLTHPNVVTVHDVGDHDGRVFIAMEFVQGQTVEEWLKTERPSWQAVTSVFRQAARGLAAAHAVGLVHRDFKPENVLVEGTPNGPDGAGGRVLVMDFGLARGADDDMPSVADAENTTDAAAIEFSTGSGRQKLTAAGALVGTPAYMSPEQFAGQSVGPASDQFSFCASLYRALFDQRPFAGDTLAALAASVRAGRLREPPQDKRVPRWLWSAIVRGLATDPRERYPTMQALVVALEAGRRGARLRLTAFGVGTAALLAGTIGWAAVAGPRPCTSGQTRWQEVWNEDRGALIAQAFEQLELPYASTTWERAKPMLETYGQQWGREFDEACAATRIEGHQSEQRMDARMDCLEQRRLYVDALLEEWSTPDDEIVLRTIPAVSGLPAVDACADPKRLDARQTDPRHSEPVAQARAAMARANAKKTAGRFEEGLLEAQAGLDVLRDIDGLPGVRAELLQTQGGLLAKTGKREDGEQAYREALEQAARAQRHGLVASLWLDLLYHIGIEQQDQAFASVAADAAGIAVLAAGNDPELQMALEDKLGILARERGAYDEATQRSRRAIALAEQQQAGLRMLEVLHHNLANTLLASGEFDEAKAVQERTLELCRELFGEEHPSMATALQGMGRIYDEMGDLPSAQRYFERALDIRKRTLGPRHPDYADALFNISRQRAQRGALDVAEAGIREAMEIWVETYGPGCERIGIAHLMLGTIAGDRDQHELAVEHALEAEEVYARLLGPDHPRTSLPIGNRANALRELERYDEALVLHQRALELTEKGHGKDHPDVAYVLVNMAEDLIDLGRATEAVPIVERAISIREKHDVEPSLLGAAYFVSAMARWDADDDRSRAVALAKKARELYDRSVVASDVPELIDSWLADKES